MFVNNEYLLQMSIAFTNSFQKKLIRKALGRKFTNAIVSWFFCTSHHDT